MREMGTTLINVYLGRLCPTGCGVSTSPSADALRAWQSFGVTQGTTVDCGAVNWKILVGRQDAGGRQALGPTNGGKACARPWESEILDQLRNRLYVLGKSSKSTTNERRRESKLDGLGRRASRKWYASDKAASAYRQGGRNRGPESRPLVVSVAVC